MRLTLSAVVAAIALSTGCSSIVSKADYPVNIQSIPENANFTITNKAGNQIHKGTTPETVNLKAGEGYFSSEEYTISVTKLGFKTQDYVLKTSIDGWYFGNLLIGGLIGMLIVDPITGAMYSLPEKATIQLNSDIAMSNTHPLTIKTIDSLSPEQKSQLVKL